MATDNAVNQDDGLVITDDYLPNNEKNDENNTNIELQVVSTDENKDNSDNKEETILYDKLKSFDIDTDLYDDEIDKHNFSKLCTEHNIDQDISDKIFNILDTNNQSFITIDNFISWKNNLSIKSIKTLLSNTNNITSPPSPDFVSPIAKLSIGMEETDAKTTDSNTTLIKPLNNTNEIHITTNSSPIHVGALEEEKYPLHQPYMTQFTENEYATKRCIRPVRNNVFMEKTVDECTSAEINFEVQRLICCLHFLAEEYNIYFSLKDYLGHLEAESKLNDTSSAFAVGNRNRKQSTHDEERTFTLVKRSNTAHHIKWLHEAYVTEREKRVSRRKLGAGNTKPPNFNNVIEKRTKLKQMHEYLSSIWRDLLNNLTMAWKREHQGDNMDIIMDVDHQVKGSKAQHNLIEDLKNRLQAKSEKEMIKKMSTFTSEEEWAYKGNEEKYDPLFESTPTVDEMVCYESLCNVIFNDTVSSHNLSDIGDFQKIKKAFGILRANDHAIASKTCGWVTSIDNLLSVLLYRDLSWYNCNFIGELRISLLIESNKSSKLHNYENKALLTAIKKSIVYAFCGVPLLQEAQDNVLDINYIVLRRKKTENNNLCSCVTRCCGQQAHLARLTFGILCDDSKPNTINTMNNKFAKQFPYKFLFQSKRLYEQIFRNKFTKLFDSSCRKQRAQLKCTEIHTYDLSIFPYPKYEMDQLLTQQFAEYLPSTHQNDNFTSSNELMTLKNYESQTIKKHIQQQDAVENYFIRSFDTSNLVEFASTIIEEDYGIMVETRIVYVLNAILSLINPTVVYSRPKKDKDDIGPMGSMDRNISNSSDTGVDRKQGHRICLGHCFLSFGMIAYALVMSIIVGIGGLNIWLIGQAPMEPTIENILGFTQKMIAAETEYVAERALFSTRQFIDFTNVLPDVTQNFDTFLDNTLITSPRFDGIMQIKNDNVSGAMSNFIFKKEENMVHHYDCNIDIAVDATGNCNADDLWIIAKNIWDNRYLGVLESYKKNNMNFSTTKRLKYFYYYIETECTQIIYNNINSISPTQPDQIAPNQIAANQLHIANINLINALNHQYRHNIKSTSTAATATTISTTQTVM